MHHIKDHAADHLVLKSGQEPEHIRGYSLFFPALPSLPAAGKFGISFPFQKALPHMFRLARPPGLSSAKQGDEIPVQIIFQIGALSPVQCENLPFAGCAPSRAFEHVTVFLSLVRNCQAVRFRPRRQKG